MREKGKNPTRCFILHFYPKNLRRFWLWHMKHTHTMSEKIFLSKNFLSNSNNPSLSFGWLDATIGMRNFIQNLWNAFTRILVKRWKICQPFVCVSFLLRNCHGKFRKFSLETCCCGGNEKRDENEFSIVRNIISALGDRNVRNIHHSLHDLKISLRCGSMFFVEEQYERSQY